MLKKFGDDLRIFRESKNISIEEICQSLKWSKSHLINIESGNFSFLPDVLIKSLLKQLSAYLGLNYEFINEKYELAKKSQEYKPLLESEKDNTNELENETLRKPQTADESLISIETDITEEVQSKPTKSFAHKHSFIAKEIIIIVVFLVSLIAFTYYVFIYSDEREILRDVPFESIVEENESRFFENEVKKIEISDSLRLSIFSSDSCWIKAIIDDHIHHEYFIFPNKSIQFSAIESIFLTLGNPRPVKLELNNQSLEFKAPSIGKLDLKINSSGITNQ